MSNTTDNIRNSIRTLIRTRDDFQAMRKRMDNRIGRKADGSNQKIADNREFTEKDSALFGDSADMARERERAIERRIKKLLEEVPIYVEFLSKVKGCGTVSAAWIISEYDIHIATTVSKLWQYTGLNPAMVRGKKRVGDSIVPTDTLVRGDKLTAGFISPFNRRLRTALIGVMADSFIKQQNTYALDFYYPYKERLQNHPEWKDRAKAHLDRAAKRYMIKMFLRDLYVAWRTLEGLEVRKPYQEEYLGHTHSG